MALPEYLAKLSQKKEIAAGVFELRFEKPIGFVYTAGQFIQILVPDGMDMTPRSYSLSSIPSDEFLELCIKIVPNGKGSTYLKELTVGESMQFRGPLGHFVCTSDADAHFLIATGVGIAPIIGMIRSELEEKKSPKGIHLLFGVRHEDDVFWIERLDALTSQYDQFSYRLTLSRPSDVWQGLKGRVTEHLHDHPVDHDFYLCGSMDMVKDVRSTLLNNGVNVKKVRMEIF